MDHLDFYDSFGPWSPFFSLARGVILYEMCLSQLHVVERWGQIGLISIYFRVYMSEPGLGRMGPEGD